MPRIIKAKKNAMIILDNIDGSSNIHAVTIDPKTPSSPVANFRSLTCSLKKPVFISHPLIKQIEFTHQLKS